MTEIPEMTDRELIDEIRQIADQMTWHRDAKLVMELIRRFEATRSPQETASE